VFGFGKKKEAKKSLSWGKCVSKGKERRQKETDAYNERKRQRNKK